MTSENELLPLPKGSCASDMCWDAEVYTANQMHAYARANMEPLLAEAEALRAEVSGLRAARIAYANEFPATEDGDPDTGNIHANIRALKARAEQLAAEVERLRSLCAAAYQMAGVHDAPVEWLDALSNAASGRKFSIDGLLPYMPDAVCEAETRAERLAEALREAYVQVRELCDCYGHAYPEASFDRYEDLLRNQEVGE